MNVDYAYKSEIGSVLTYAVRLMIPVEGLQERIDREGADEAALTLGRIVLNAIRPLEGHKGIGNG